MLMRRILKMKDILCLSCLLLQCMNECSGLIHYHSGSTHTGTGGSIHTGTGGSFGTHGGSSFDTCKNCDCAEYKNIIAFGSGQDCTDENKLFPLLKALYDKSHDCHKQAIDHLAGTFASMSDTPSYCQCSGYNHFHHYTQSGHDSRFLCYPDWNFDYFFNRYFYHFGEPPTPPTCRTHHAMWRDLAKISSPDCQSLLVKHIAAVFSDSDPCSCTKAVMTNPPSSAVNTTNTTTTTTTTIKPVVVSSVATTSAPIPLIHNSPGKYQCGKLSTVESIAIQHQVTETNATLCSSGNRQGSDESFVLLNCNVSSPSEWKQGINVMEHCKDMPTYIPIATFIGGKYYPSLAESGVLMGCLNNGFKLGIQHCNGVPTIDHVLTNGTGLQNANLFFTIV